MTVAPKSDAAPLGSYLLWALLTLLGLWLGSLAAAEVPASWKRLLLFPAACGLLGGWLAGTLWHRLQCGRPSRIHLLVTGQLLLLALANITLVNYQQHLAQTPQLNQALLMLEGISQSSPELQAETQRQKAELTPSFPKYLRYRVSHLADWSIPSATLFWLIELSAGAACGTWLFRRIAINAAAINLATQREPSSEVPTSSF